MNSENPPRRLESTRLVLRRHRQGDAAKLSALLNNWNVACWLSRIPYPYGPSDAEDWIAQTERSWLQDRDFQFIVTLPEDDILIGHAGIRRVGPKQGELGYWYGEPYWRRGFAREAAGTLLDFAFQHLDLHEVVAYCHPQNRASAKVLTAAGMRQDGQRSIRFAQLGERVGAPRYVMTAAERLAAKGAGQSGPAANGLQGHLVR